MHNIILALIIIGFLSPTGTTYAREKPLIVRQENCSYAKHKRICYETVAPWNTLGIENDGTFVIANGANKLRHPSKDMLVEMTPAGKKYLARYGFPEYLRDQRLWHGTVKSILLRWSVETVGENEIFSPKQYLIVVENQAGQVIPSSISIEHPIGTVFAIWKAKTE
ncbi:MAG: hypothetical protein WCT49_05635 [Candidatus Paceibacterota bacterium]|jgi:hypothetical protein|nr:hypothetical protein [Candidatus Paceibacterota bacterium]